MVFLNWSGKKTSLVTPTQTSRIKTDFLLAFVDKLHLKRHFFCALDLLN